MKTYVHIVLTAILSVLTFSFFFSIPETSFAQEDDAFTKYMMEGIRCFKAGKTDPSQYKKAIESFEAAHRLEPTPDAIYNIARSYHMLQDCSNALKYYREYAATSTDNAQSVERYISELATQCESKGILQLRCTPSNLTVSIDNGPAMVCIPEQTVPAGSHKLKFMADGYETETREVNISSDTLRVTPIAITLKKSSVSAPSVSSGSPSSAASSVQSDTSAQTEHSAAVTDASSGQETFTYSPDGSPTKLFWTGVGLVGGGAVFTLIGGIVLGSAYDKVKFAFTNSKNSQVEMEFYEKNGTAVGAGGAFLGIGLAAVIGGTVAIILDKVYFNKKDDPTSMRAVPVFTFSPDAASAGVAVSF